jgi:hypothetical protein
MQTRSFLQRRATSESSDRLIVNLKPRSWGDEIHEHPQTVEPQTSGFDFRNADWFSHDPGSRTTPSVLRGIQAKLTVGAPNDVYEQEADRVAEQVMSTPDSAIQQPIQREEMPEEEKELQTKPLAATITPLVQREVMPEEEEELQTKPLGDSIQREAMPEEEEEIQTKPLENSIQREALPEEEEEIQTKPLGNLIQREAMPEEEEELQTKPLDDSIQLEVMPEEEEEIQTKRSPNASFQADSNLENRLSSSQDGGSPLSDEVRSFMEPRFGADFSQVRVHTGNEAVQMNQDLNAHAFTHKQDVYFGSGKSPGNDALTAHELTHVVQQTGEARSRSIQQQQLFQQKSGCLSKASSSNIVHRKYEQQFLPNWGSAGGKGSKMDLNPFARLIVDGKQMPDNWDISGSNPAVFKAPQCTKNGEVQIIVDGRWTQNNVFVNDGGSGRVVVSSPFEVNEKGEVHFKTATESHSIIGTAAQMTGAGIASDNPPNGGSLVAQVAITATDSTSTGNATTVSGSGKAAPGGVGIDVGVSKEVSTGTTTPSGNSFSRGYRVDLTVEKREAKPMALTQPVFFKVGKHKIIGSKDKGQPANIKDIYAFLQKLPPDVRKELEDGKGDGKAQIQVLAKASVTTPSRPDAGFNLELSEKRRDAVVRILQNFLGSGVKIKAKAVGELEAVEPGEADMERVADITVTWENDPCKTDSAKP